MSVLDLIIFVVASSSTSSAAVLNNITAEPGQNVTLTCEAPNIIEMKTLEWSRPDLVGKFVFLYRSYNLNQDDQHESFRSRVFLRDRQMKNGNMSVILKNVTFNDTGTYECKIKHDQSEEMKLISIIHLLVSPAGSKDGKTEVEQHKDRDRLGLIGLPVLLAVVLVGLWIYK